MLSLTEIRKFASTCIAACLCAVPALALGAGLETYIVLYQKNAVPADAAKTIAGAGGVLVASYDPIGVVIAQSTVATFATTMKRVKGVQAAVATTNFGVGIPGASAVDVADFAASVPVDPPLPAPGSDSLSGLQWDMDQISAPEARAISGGSRSIIVGNIDTGVDYTHPDLAANVDGATSVNCVGGVPVPGMVAANDDNGHGTHTAGTIAASLNGIGIVGVAPNVRIAAIKAGNADGFFFPEAVVCAFMWVATHNIKITNNSYFADPWLFNCKNDPEQRAIWEAERRAIKLAIKNGAVVIAMLGNQSDDLAHPTQDSTSPDNAPTPLVRDITNACAVVPVEVPGVVGVSANGNLELKSFYSSYGVGVTQIIAPGGDSILQLTAAAPNGRVLSTWPASLINVTCLPTRRVIDASGATYCYQQGTSMAAPHVAGVAALIASNGVRSPGAIVAKLLNTADPIECPPDPLIYAPFPALDNGAPQRCTGGAGYNSFNGHGQVNALTAVTH